MRKPNIVFLVLSLFVTTSPLQSQSEYILEKATYYGNVKRVYNNTIEVSGREDLWEFKNEHFATGKIYEFNDDKTFHSISHLFQSEKPALFFYEFKNDREGNLISGQLYGQHNNQAYTNISFWKEGNRTSEVIETDAETKDTIATYFFQYSGEHLKNIHFTNYRENNKLIYYYGERKLLKKIEVYGNDQKLLTSSEYSYNDNLCPQLILVYDANGEEINRQSFQYQYDEKGNWTTSLMLDKKKDKYLLTKQVIVYEDEIPKNKFAKQQLKGFWKGLAGKALFVFRDKTYEFRTEEDSYEGETYDYNPYSGELQIKASHFSKHSSSYTVLYDGKVLTLTNTKSSQTFLLYKIDPGQLTLDEQRTFEEKGPYFKNLENFTVNGKTGFREKGGKVLIPAEYDIVSIAAFRKTLKVKKGELWGVYDYYGKKLTPIKYKSIDGERYGFLNYTLNRNKLGVLSPSGKEILSDEYDDVSVTADLKIVVIKDRLQGVIDTDGEELLPVIYEKIFLSTLSNRIVAWTYKNGFHTDWYNKRYQLIKKFEGRRNIDQLNLNCYKIRVEGGWSLIDSMGNMVSTAVFEEIEAGTGNTLLVKKYEKWGVSDLKGKLIVTPKYNRIIFRDEEKKNSSIITGINSNNAMAMFMGDGHFGYLDGYGQERLPIPTRWFEDDRFTKNYEEGERFNFRYSSKWNQNGKSLYKSKNKRSSATFRIDSSVYEGTFIAWLEQQHPGKEFQVIEVDKIKVYSIGQIYDQQMGAIKKKSWKQQFYIPLNSSEVLVLEAYSTAYDYPAFAQDVYDMIYSLKILN